MVFSSLVFLFVFLPLLLVFYSLAPKRLKNFLLLLASLIFYAWGEPVYVLLMIFSIIINYSFGLLIDSFDKKQPTTKKWILVTSIIANIGILGYYKYSSFVIENLNILFNLQIAYQPLPLPIGISFFTFQAMSYVIDVYRKDTQVQKNLFDLALYISLFPQLVAGPIVRYTTIAEQIRNRIHNLPLFSEGIRQFILGLSKKVLLANPLGEIADAVFANDPTQMSVATTWIGIAAYTLQIYFDFSGYSDMAIGLGKMFGFKFLQNFNYPYIAQSIRDFWRRWHISLSTWFRDYVYIPLGGSQKRKWHTYRNILIVWTLTGFWHGASWTFMAWGFYYGILIAIEHLGWGKILEKAWRPLQHLYVIFIVMIGWVFFRADNFSYSFEFLQTMFGLNGKALLDPTALMYLHDKLYLFILALLFSMPIYPWILNYLHTLEKENGQTGINKDGQGVRKFTNVIVFLHHSLSPVVYIILLILSTMFLVNSTYNPFIYFRF